MLRRSTLVSALLAAAILALPARPADGASVQELVRIKGHEMNVLTGLGIVVGLPGTGDTSKSSYVAARPYARLLRELGNPTEQLDELVKADAYALVLVTMRVPPQGAREGDRLKVSVEKLFNAKSLAGGRLVFSLLRPPLPDAPDLVPMAFAEGPLVIEGDNPSSAVIPDGGQMLADVRANPVSPDGTITLVLNEEYASYTVAWTIAEAINEPDGLGDDDATRIAVVEDAKNVRVRIPAADRADPANFIAWLLQIPIDPTAIRTPARVVVNERIGSIAVTGNVEIGPVGITHRGMQLSTLAPGGGAWAGLDTTDGTSRASTRLVDLLAALDRLKVPVADQIDLVYQLKRTGALHAEIVRQ